MSSRCLFCPIYTDSWLDTKTSLFFRLGHNFQNTNRVLLPDTTFPLSSVIRKLADLNWLFFLFFFAKEKKRLHFENLLSFQSLLHPDGSDMEPLLLAAISGDRESSSCSVSSGGACESFSLRAAGPRRTGYRWCLHAQPGISEKTKHVVQVLSCRAYESRFLGDFLNYFLAKVLVLLRQLQL